MSHRPQDDGVTLVELLVVIALMGVMMAIAVGGWSAWASARAHSGTADAIQSLMRQTQQRAVTEGVSMCIWFDTAADQYAVYRGTCDDSGKELVQGPMDTEAPEVRIESPAFAASATSGGTPGVTFRARGSAWPGRVVVARDGADDHVVTVKGLTGHVSLS